MKKIKIFLNDHLFKFRFYELISDDVHRWSCALKSCKSNFKFENNYYIIDQSYKNITTQRQTINY